METGNTGPDLTRTFAGGQGGSVGGAGLVEGRLDLALDL